MHINATFLIQIINFIITYKMLDVFLFRPAITSLEKKNAKRQNLETDIQKEEKKLVALEEKKKEKVVTFQGHVKKAYPFISPTAHGRSIELPEIPTEEIDTKKLQEEVTALLIEKVPHAY